MAYDAYPVLCGGTFFTLILEAHKQRTGKKEQFYGRKDGLSEPETLAGLIKVMYPEYKIPSSETTFKTNTSEYKKCINNGGNLPFFEQEIRAFDIRVKGDYITALISMSEFINRFIEVGGSVKKDEWLVKALIDLIESDQSIKDDDEFYVFENGTAMTKSTIPNVIDICLPAFLLGIWHFVVVNRQNNTTGKNTFNNWCPPNNRKPRVYTGNMGETIMRTINVTTHIDRDLNEENVNIYETNDDSSAEIKEATDMKMSKPNFTPYIKKAKEKYNTIKTFLYSDHPKPFYDFYVCNDIKREIRVPGKFGTSYKYATIRNVNFKSLKEYSRFVILAGTGGLGKSMMMRHLLLNSIENYKEMLTIPVFIPLKDFDENVDNLFDYVFSKITSLCGNITEKQFIEVLEGGKCLLLFDGLDEIGSTYAEQFERKLEVFTDKYPDNCFVISSRPYQYFISYSRFTVLQLKPFSKQQALMLIDNLEFRPDMPIIKEKFRAALNGSLYNTHSTFIQNPLLLTIMLLTFEQYAEVPSKMHLFYREAFAALSVKHDASKGAYKRTLRTGLTADKFADYFAELCSRSYHDEKFEMTEDEFSNYYKVLKEREKANDITTTARDYLYDLCSNMCLMHLESGKYQFTHRSFQEYFCALYFSRQKDKNLASIGGFFENRHIHMFDDNTFKMLYDMIPDKVEEYIFLPYLTSLYERCDNEEGYWTFLGTLYPTLSYAKGETDYFVRNFSQSYIYNFIKQLNWRGSIDCTNFPHYDLLVTGEYVYVTDEDESDKLVNKEDVGWEEYGTPDTVGWIYEFEVESVRKAPSEYTELLSCLDDENFRLRKEYNEMHEYLQELQVKHTPSVGNSLFDLFN